MSMETVDSILKEVYLPLFQAEMDSPFLQGMALEAQARWNALPWYKKKYKLFKAAVRDYRRTVGEWVAGEKFSDS